MFVWGFLLLHLCVFVCIHEVFATVFLCDSSLRRHLRPKVPFLIRNVVRRLAVPSLDERMSLVYCGVACCDSSGGTRANDDALDEGSETFDTLNA